VCKREELRKRCLYIYLLRILRCIMYIHIHRHIYCYRSYRAFPCSRHTQHTDTDTRHKTQTQTQTQTQTKTQTQTHIYRSYRAFPCFQKRRLQARPERQQSCLRDLRDLLMPLACPSNPVYTGLHNVRACMCAFMCACVRVYSSQSVMPEGCKNSPDAIVIAVIMCGRAYGEVCVCSGTSSLVLVLEGIVLIPSNIQRCLYTKLADRFTRTKLAYYSLHRGIRGNIRCWA
jgi:hypothetical protein